MTADEPLLVRYPQGWGWGPRHGLKAAIYACVVARALGQPVLDYAGDAIRTSLGRRLTYEEAMTIWMVDNDRATDEDREIILRLATAMGVEP